MGFNKRKMEAQRTAAAEKEAAAKRATERQVLEDAGCLVAAWNERQAKRLRNLDRHPWSALTSLIPALSCRACRPHAPFAQLVRLSRTSIADELREEHTRRVLGE